MVHHTGGFSRDPAGVSAFVLKKRWAFLQGAAEFFGRHASHAPKDPRDMAGACIADL
jgi:hypothetical protein